eukprot:gene3809-13879_t
MMPPGSDTSIEEVLASLDTVKAELRKASLEVKPSKASLYTGMEPPVSKASMDFNVHEVLASLDTVKAELLNASLGVNPTLDKDKATLYTLEPPGSKTSMDQHIQEVLESLDSVRAELLNGVAASLRMDSTAHSDTPALSSPPSNSPSYPPSPPSLYPSYLCISASFQSSSLSTSNSRSSSSFSPCSLFDQPKTEWGRLRASFPKNQSDPGSEQAMEMLAHFFGTGPGPGPTFCPGPGINFNLFIRNSLTY